MDHPDFIHNKYFRWYVSLVSKPDAEGYIERHHIIPKCMGGKNGTNLVKLTPRKHFLAHWLLTKFVVGTLRRKMTFAFTNMRQRVRGKRILAAWQHDLIRRKHSEECSGERNNRYGKKFPHTPEAKAKIRAASTLMWADPEHKEVHSRKTRGRPITEEHRKALCAAQQKLVATPAGMAQCLANVAKAQAKAQVVNKGAKRPPEVGLKISKARTGMKFTAEHCANLSKRHKGRKWPEEVVARRKASAALTFAKRKEAKNSVGSELPPELTPST